MHWNRRRTWRGSVSAIGPEPFAFRRLQEGTLSSDFPFSDFLRLFKESHPLFFEAA